MRRLLLLCLLALGSSISAATIDFSEAADHVGEEATVTGKVSGVSTIGSGMTFVNFGGRSFTAVARPGTVDPEVLKGYEGKTVEVTGMIELFKDSPQIVLKSAEDIGLPGEGAAKISPVKLFSVPLDRRETKAAGESTAGVIAEEAACAIFIPDGFDPTKNQKILAVFPDFFSDGDLEKLIAPYTAIANKRGVVVLAARGASLELDLKPIWHTIMFQAAIRHLEEEYPGIGESIFYVAGSADGASRASLSSAAMIGEGMEVKGAFLTSLKRENFNESIRTFRPSRSKIKHLKVFVSHGEEDGMVSGEASLEQTEAIREAGLKEVRHESHPGRTGVDPDSLASALDWFSTEE